MLGTSSSGRQSTPRLATPVGDRPSETGGATAAHTQAGQLIDLGDGVTIEVLHPAETLMTGTDSDLNNASIVLRVVYGDVSFLLTGDIFVEAEREILSRGADVRSTVIKVPHHGSRSSSSREFIERVHPSVAVISVGADNRLWTSAYGDSRCSGSVRAGSAGDDDA